MKTAKKANRVGKADKGNKATLEMVLVKNLCDRVNESRFEAAIDGYLDGDLHAEFTVADIMARRLANETAKLKRGKFENRFSVCCCGDTFSKILCEKPQITYVGCTTGGETDEERADLANALVRVDFAAVPDDRLFDFLTEEQECVACNFTAIHKEDREAQNAYYSALVNYLEVAAAFAKSIGSMSARSFIEALYYLQPRNSPDCDSCGLGLSASDVDKAFALIQEAQTALWADLRLKNLKPLRVCRGNAAKGKR